MLELSTRSLKCSVCMKHFNQNFYIVRILPCLQVFHAVILPTLRTDDEVFVYEEHTL